MTRQPRVRLTPAPFFSEDAAKGYRRITGALLETDLEDRLVLIAGVGARYRWCRDFGISIFFNIFKHTFFDISYDISCD